MINILHWNARFAFNLFLCKLLRDCIFLWNFLTDNSFLGSVVLPPKQNNPVYGHAIDESTPQNVVKLAKKWLIFTGSTK